mmetsp:Transcript_4583/g.16124  ORF Transcript_4583/g.16124 Transcript_4583/m.16124 type:complete len:379 (+) Transcript_4583:345-1481(+)
MFSADSRASYPATIIIPPEHYTKAPLEHDGHNSRFLCDSPAQPQGDWIDWLLTKQAPGYATEATAFDFDLSASLSATGPALTPATPGQALPVPATPAHPLGMAVTPAEPRLCGFKRSREEPHQPQPHAQPQAAAQAAAESRLGAQPTAGAAASPPSSPSAAAAAAATALPAAKRRATKKRKNVAVKVDKLLKPLGKQQLLDLLLKLTQDPEIEAQIRVQAPAFDVREVMVKLRKLSAALYKSFPHTRYGSSYDHYTYARVQPQEAAFIKAAKKPLQMLVDSRQWLVALQFLEAVVAEAAELPNWDCPDDCKAKRALFRCFASNLLKIIRGLDDTELPQERWLRLRELCVAHHNVNAGLHFENCIREVNARIIPRGLAN